MGEQERQRHLQAFHEEAPYQGRPTSLPELPLGHPLAQGIIGFLIYVRPVPPA